MLEPLKVPDDREFRAGGDDRSRALDLRFERKIAFTDIRNRSDRRFLSNCAAGADVGVELGRRPGGDTVHHLVDRRWLLRIVPGYRSALKGEFI